VQSLWVSGKREEAIRRVPDELVLAANFIGTETMVRERLDAYRAAGINTLRLATGGNTWPERTAALEAAMDLIQRAGRDG
jgi:hypothetical protein